MATLLELVGQRGGALERAYLAEELVEVLLPGGAQGLAVDTLDLVAGDGTDQLVAAHADVAVQAPDREHDVVLPKGAVPTQRMLVVGVDERPVDVEECCALRYDGVASACTVGFCP